MIIYKSDTNTFTNQVRNNAVADLMKDNFESYYGNRVSNSEYRSWQNSSNFVKNIIEKSNLKDNYILLEYELPHSQSRLDCMLFGVNEKHEPKIILIELKQWDKVKPSYNEGNYVCTFVGGGIKEVPHPSEQVKGYHNYLNDFVEYLHNEDRLTSFAYCHNFTKDETSFLYDEKFESLMKIFPLYCKNDTDKISDLLKENISYGNGLEVFNRFMDSKIYPSKKLLESVSKMIEGNEVFSLLNEQIVAKNTILSILKRNYKKKTNKNIVIIKGGPGTGKSVIALHILSFLAKFSKKDMNIMWVCKSKSFREGILDLIHRNHRGLFNNLYKSINPNVHEENEYDAIIVDEAHRIEKKGDTRWTPRNIQSDMPMIDRIIRAANTSIFFIDDNQLIRGLEIGSTKLIKETAQKYEAIVDEIKLKSQFRCNGSNSYLNWLESVLGYRDKPIKLKKDDPFDFKIVGSPKELYDLLLEKESKKANSARLTAGFCWPWSDHLDDENNLVRDVRIGTFAMPWETHNRINVPPEGYVKWYEWAYKPDGIKQVGCIYTAQGFEFDYIGVIFGNDLQYSKITDSLIGSFEDNKDPALRNDSNFESYVRNIYRVLMTRGLKGCYVYFVNKETENYFKRFIDKSI